jgi:oligogalacturonide lyase
MQVYRIDLKTGEWRRLTDAQSLDPATVALTPDERDFWYCDGPAIMRASTGGGRAREVQRVQAGWERSSLFAGSYDTESVAWVETQGSRSRIRHLVRSSREPRTVAELDGPVTRILLRSSTLVYHAGDALYLARDTGGHRRLALAEGIPHAPVLGADAQTLFYILEPPAPKRLRELRHYDLASNTDKLVGPTSQFVSAGRNADASVFVGASGSRAAPYVLLLLRAARREFTLCEHRSSDPAAVMPLFSPNSQRIFFNSDRHGKMAVYSMRVDRIVEETEET